MLGCCEYIVVRGLLLLTYCVVLVVCCPLSVICCLTFVVCGAWVVARCVSVVVYVLFVVCCLLFVVRCLRGSFSFVCLCLLVVGLVVACGVCLFLVVLLKCRFLCVYHVRDVC